MKIPDLSRTGLSLPVLTFLLFVSSIFLTGYGVHTGNQAGEIPVLKQLSRPDLYPGDPFVARSPFRLSVLWWILARLVPLLPLEGLLLFLFLLERGLGILAAGRLARSFVPGSPLAVFAARLLFSLPLSPLLGHGTLVRNYPEQTGLALSFFLLAVADFRENRPFRCAVLLAVGFDLNCVAGGFALSYLAVSFLLDPGRRGSWQNWILPLACFLGLAIPAFALIFDRPGPYGPPDGGLWLSASFLRSPHHLLPLTWGKKAFLGYALFAGVALFSAVKARSASPSLSRDCLGWMTVSLGWLACAFASAYLFREPRLLNLPSARGGDLGYALIAIALTSLAAQRLDGRGDRKSLAIFLALLGFLALILTTAPGPRLLALLLFLASGVALLPLRPVRPLALGQNPAHLMVHVTLLLVLVASGVLLLRFLAGPGGLWTDGGEGIRVVSEWARARTAPGARFLVDPFWSQFRSLSERSAFVTWEDGTTLFYDRSLAGEWAERLRRLGCQVPAEAPNESRAAFKGCLAEGYSRLGDEQAARIRVDYGVDYWIVPRNHPSRFREVYSDGRWVVLDLRAPAGAPARS